MTELLFIRHGETDHNKNRLFYGHLDPDINQTGIEQLNKTKLKLQKFEEKIDGQVVKRYIAVSQKKKRGYYCIDIYDDLNSQPKATLTARLNITKNKNGYFITPKDDLKIQYKGKTYKNQDALNFLGF